MTVPRPVTAVMPPGFGVMGKGKAGNLCRVPALSCCPAGKSVLNEASESTPPGPLSGPAPEPALEALSDLTFGPAREVNSVPTPIWTHGPEGLGHASQVTQPVPAWAGAQPGGRAPELVGSNPPCPHK